MKMIKRMFRRFWPVGGNQVKRNGDVVVCHFPSSEAGCVETFPSPLKTQMSSVSFFRREAGDKHLLVMSDAGKERVLATFGLADDARDALRVVFSCLARRPWRWVVRLFYGMAVVLFLVVVGQFMGTAQRTTSGEIPSAATGPAPFAQAPVPSAVPEAPAPAQQQGGGLADFGLQQ